MLNTPSPDTSRLSRLFILLAAAFAAFIITIIALANQNADIWLFRLQGSIPHADKIGHFVLIGGMTLFANLALMARQVKVGSRQILLGSLIVLIVFTAEEITQLGLVHRNFDLGDLTADYLGIFVFGRIAKSIVARLKAA